MSEQANRTLQAKFFFGLLFVLLGLVMFYSFLFQKLAKTTLQTQAEETALLILDHAESIQAYIRESLRPKMFEVLPENHFIIEAMSTSYVTRRIMSDLNRSKEKYLYRRVAVDARNPDFEAKGLELELIGKLKDKPHGYSWLEFREIGGTPYLLAARGVVFEESCMRCHGSPAEAPAEVVALYGSKRGFNRELGEVSGLDMVSFPVHSELALINSATMALIGVFILGTLGSFGLIQTMFQRLVVHNLKRVTDKLSVQFSGQADSKILGKLERSDQIEKIVLGVDELAGHLRQARSELEEHAQNLESKVIRRTAALREEASSRQAELTLFVDMLHLLNKNPRLHEELRISLERLAKHFKADAAAMVCAVGIESVLYWPSEALASGLPGPWRSVVAECSPHFEPGLAVVPVSSTDVGRGALCLSWSDGFEPDEQSKRLLCALGLQLGIALDNIDALEAHLKQKNLLQMVFEGIADPVALLDGSGNVVLCNEYSRQSGLLDLLLKTGSVANAVLEKALKDNSPTTYENALADGRAFAVSLYPLPAASRGNDRLVVYAREITAEKKMLEGIQVHEKMATVGRLAAGLAHEINNPLGVIQCYADLLLLKAPQGREREDLEIILRHTQQAKKILSDLLFFARPQKTGPARCSPVEVLTRLDRVFTVQAQAKKIEFHFESPGALPEIGVAESVLEQIAGNLLLNALDAVSPGSGVVWLAVREETGLNRVVIMVKDNGPGVPDSAKSRIFEPFYTTKEAGKGTGLGLAVVYGLVSEAGGSVELLDCRGACFEVSLPLAANPAAKEGHESR